MKFDELALSAALKNRIASHIDSGRFPHACVISGQDAEQLYALAKNIARALVCASPSEKPCGACRHCTKAMKDCHPDIITVQPGKDERELKVEQVRALVRDAVILPNEADSKIYIIRSADSMNPAAQNAFLKLLEEPPRYAVFLLLAENTAALLETVRSRCAQFVIERLEASGKTSGQSSALAQEYYETLCSVSELDAACFSLKLEKLDRQSFADFTGETIRFLALKLRENALGKPEKAGKVRLNAAVGLMRELENMQNFNVSVGHMAGKLAADTAEIILK